MNCSPRCGTPSHGVFDWDDEAGTVDGPDAAVVRDIASWGGISAHPLPWAHEFSAEPLKSKTDMAAIIGWEHRLPPDLEDFYPQLEDDGIPEVTYVNEDGVTVLGRDRILY